MRANTANEGDLALVYNINNLQGLFQYTNNNWEVAPTGLTATNEYVVDSIFWGANGVEQGTLQVNNNLTTDQIKIKAQVYNDLSYLELDPNITNLDRVFEDRDDLNAVANINTINITSMKYAFKNCKNLVSIPNFDTSNIVKGLDFMFSNCYNLMSIPEFNTINVKFMSSMFENCKNLTSIPNFSTSNVTTMMSAFEGCTNLGDVPQLNFVNVTSMFHAFEGCTNLSINSYANIANSLPNASQLSNQYIADIGLNINRFTTEQLTILNQKGYVDAII